MRDQLLSTEVVCSVRWCDGTVHILDQRMLPDRSVWLSCVQATEVAQAIRTLSVRGAAAIAICAAYAVAMSVRRHFRCNDQWFDSVLRDIAELESARPTVFNLLQVLAHLRDQLQRHSSADHLPALMEAEAVAIHQCDREANLAMAEYGLGLIRRHQEGAQCLMTHGNAGALATGGFGTALGVVRAAWRRQLVERIYTDETRPLLLGSRLTAWELAQEHIPVTVVADSAASHLMKTEPITWLVLGADRIAANGDVVGKIGSYQLSVAAMHHGVRVMVVASSCCIDMSLCHGDEVVLEERAAGELLAMTGEDLGGEVAAFNPVYDITPADLIDFLVTEKGVVDRPDAEKLAQLMCRKRLH